MLSQMRAARDIRHVGVGAVRHSLQDRTHVGVRLREKRTRGGYMAQAPFVAPRGITSMCHARRLPLGNATNTKHQNGSLDVNVAGHGTGDDERWLATCIMAAMAREPVSMLVAALAAAITLGAKPALGRRIAPQPVPPVIYAGVRYEAPHFLNPCGQNGGCVVAYDNDTGEQLWFLEVYCTHYDPGWETDVQDVFITSMAITDGQLMVTNERNLHFTIDVVTRQVSGDGRGCPE